MYYLLNTFDFQLQIQELNCQNRNTQHVHLLHLCRQFSVYDNLHKNIQGWNLILRKIQTDSHDITLRWFKKKKKKSKNMTVYVNHVAEFHISTLILYIESFFIFPYERREWHSATYDPLTLNIYWNYNIIIYIGAII